MSPTISSSSIPVAAPSRPESPPSRRGVKPKRTWNGISKALPRFFVALFLCRFAWDIYLLHSTSWPEDLFLHQARNDHRFLERYRSTVWTNESDDHARPHKGYDRVRRPLSSALDSTIQAEKSFVKLRTHVMRDLARQATHGFNWTELCAESGLGKSSRVLILNVIRQPAATFTAAALAARCKVRVIAGTDAMFPNLRNSRMRHMQIYKKLFQTIPQFRMFVTSQGLRRANDKAIPSWLFDFSPTHVLVSEHLADERSIDDIMTRQSYQFYSEEHSLQLWTDLFSGLSLQKQRNRNEGPRIVQLAAPMVKQGGPQQSADSNIPFLFAACFQRNITRVVLPRFYGPGSSILTSTDDPLYTIPQNAFAEIAPHIHVDDALRAIIVAFRAPAAKGFHRLEVPKQFLLNSEKMQTIHAEKSVQGKILARRVRRAIAWNDYLRNPFGRAESKLNFQQSPESFSGFDGIGQYSYLPCASQCASPHLECAASVFDALIKISRDATSRCQFVVYMGNFSNHLKKLSVIEDAQPPNLCRIAFVSKNSRLLQGVLREFQNEGKDEKGLQKMNGKLVNEGWVLMWPEHDFDNFTVGDASLLRIDPSRLFSPNVQKALYAGTNTFSGISNARAMRMFTLLDRKGYKEGQRRYREHRSGTHLSRWIPQAAAKPRRSVLFSGSVYPPGQSSSDHFLNTKDICGAQAAFYKQVMHRVHTNDQRPEFEIRSTLYKSFPFQFISPHFLVHNLQMEEGRILRCEWLEEHVSWSGMKQVKGAMEELSLAFVLGRRKTMGLIGQSDPQDEKITKFMPFLVPNAEGEAVVDKRGAEVYIGLLEPKG